MRPTIRQFPLAGVASREVTNEDIPRILQTLPIMNVLLAKKGGLALAHIQVADKDPLRFYVHKSGSFLINPEIIRHTEHTVEKKEGCLSYCTKAPIMMDRYRKIEVRYQTIQYGDSPQVPKESPPVLSEPEVMSLVGEDAQITQHEIEHMDGFNIYNEV